MKSVSLRYVQQNLAAFVREVEAGQEIEIRRRNVPVARLVPLPCATNRDVDWSGVAERRKQLWGGKRAPGTAIDRIVSEARGDR